MAKPKFILIDGVDRAGKTYMIDHMKQKFRDSFTFLEGPPKNRPVKPENETFQERFQRFLSYNLLRSEEVKEALAQGKHVATDGWYFPRTVSSHNVLYNRNFTRRIWDFAEHVYYEKFVRPDLVVPLLVDYQTIVDRLQVVPPAHGYESDPLLLLQFQAELIAQLCIYEHKGIVGLVSPVSNTIQYQAKAASTLDRMIKDAISYGREDLCHISCKH